MVKKVFALASVTALTGLVSTVAAAGCSSSDSEVTASPDATPDARRSSRETGPVEEPEVGESYVGCVAKDPIDSTQFPYKKAVKSVGACSEKELEDLSKYFAEKAGNEDVKVSEWSKVVSEQCSECVFSDGTEAEWTPILIKDDRLDNVNRGGCVEIMSGKEACGAAYQRVADCRLEACVNTCDTQDEFTACLQDTASIFLGPCKESYVTLEEECGTNLQVFENGCRGSTWTFEGPVNVQCVTGGIGRDGG